MYRKQYKDVQVKVCPEQSHVPKGIHTYGMHTSCAELNSGQFPYCPRACVLPDVRGSARAHMYLFSETDSVKSAQELYMAMTSATTTFQYGENEEQAEKHPKFIILCKLIIAKKNIFVESVPTTTLMWKKMT